MKLSTQQSLDYWIGGAGIFILSPYAKMLGHLLQRDHSLIVKDRLAVIKMLGGGSLVIALPALLGFRRQYPDVRLTLVTLNSIKPFAEAISIFDEIIIVDDRSIPSLVVSGVRLFRKLFMVDTIVDFEVYSRLTTVLSTLLCARNRLGFYLENTTWRRCLVTHLFFFNRYAGSFHFYDSTLAALGAKAATVSECGFHVARANGIEANPHPVGVRVTVEQAASRICIAPGSSEFGKERRLSGAQWAKVLPRLVGEATEIVILGGGADAATAEDLMRHCETVLPGVSWANACDGRPLRESLALLAGCSRLLAIDSALLHFGRIFGIPTFSFWGPTDPMSRIKDVPGLGEAIWYEKLVCSPCVHVAESPPCAGRNVCIEAAVRRCCGEEVDSITELSHLSPVQEAKDGLY